MTDSQLENPIPEALVNAEHLPSLPALALEVLRLTGDERTTLDDLANTIARDPALAAKLLKLANSPLFNTGHEVTSLHRAMMVLGFKTVKLMSLSFSLAGEMPRSGDAGVFDFDEYWQRSMISAVAGRSLADLVGSRTGDEAFVCGLVGHIGRLVMAQCLPLEYGEVLIDSSWAPLEKEHQFFGFDSTDVVVALLTSWNLPRVMSESLAQKKISDDLPADTDEERKSLVRVLCLANRIEDVILSKEDGGIALAELHRLAESYFGLKETEVDAFVISLEPAIADMAKLLSIEMPMGVAHKDIIDRARMQMVDVSLGTAVDLREARQRTERLEGENRVLESKAFTDKLTGLANRAAFDRHLADCVEQRLNERLPRALGIAMVDVDRFKSFNDTYGHQIGDEVLRLVGGVLQRMTRKGDIPCRYGGEEFAVICPRTTPFGIKMMCERLREAIEKEVLELEDRKVSVTASFGAACVAEMDSLEDGKALIQLADCFLYKAKENGRNRCEVFPKIHFAR